MAALENFIGEWKKPDAPAFERLVPAHRPEVAARFVSYAAVGEPGAAVVALHQALPLNRDADDYFALLVGSRILAGGGIGGNRLADRLRSRDALSYSVGAQLRVPSDGDRAALRLQASGAPVAAARVEAAMREEIARLLADGVSEAEVEQARQQLRVERRQQLSSDAGLAAALLGQFERNTTFAQAMARDDQRLDGLSAEQVTQTLRRLLRPEAWVTVVTGALQP
jgi:zinc protease